MWDENPTRQSLVIGFEREPAESEGLFNETIQSVILHS